MRDRETAQNSEKPAVAGLSCDGRGGFRTCDLSRVKQRGASVLRAFMPGNQPNRMPRTVIGSSPIRPGMDAFGPTDGPTEESASCRRRVVCSVNAHPQRSARWLGIRPPEPAGCRTARMVPGSARGRGGLRAAHLQARWQRLPLEPGTPRFQACGPGSVDARNTRASRAPRVLGANPRFAEFPMRFRR
jgi:hypothetical protein